MRSASSAARSRPWRSFPPQDLARRARVRALILRDLREEQVSSSRGRAVPRGVKRKMSNFPLRPRRRLPTRRPRYRVQVLKRHRRRRSWSRRSST